ncbi:hypothetical protein ABZP36_005196 [Zizania latifolia]
MNRVLYKLAFVPMRNYPFILAQVNHLWGKRPDIFVVNSFGSGFQIGKFSDCHGSLAANALHSYGHGLQHFCSKSGEDVYRTGCFANTNFSRYDSHACKHNWGTSHE